MRTIVKRWAIGFYVIELLYPQTDSNVCCNCLDNQSPQKYFKLYYIVVLFKKVNLLISFTDMIYYKDVLTGA